MGRGGLIANPSNILSSIAAADMASIREDVIRLLGLIAN